MDAEKSGGSLFRDRKINYASSKEDKFKIVKCTVEGIYCKELLPEINKLYAQAELARINREYQKSTDLLEMAYAKTLELKESACSVCVDFFQSSITATMEDMQEEVYQMSVGFFRRKRYQLVYERMRSFIQKMKLIKIGGANFFITNNGFPAG